MDIARGEAQNASTTASADCVALLFDEVASLVLPLLTPDSRARAACVRKAWRAAAADPSLWAELSFERCSVVLTDATIASLCARAGSTLRSLCLDHWYGGVTAEGTVFALYEGGCTGIRRISSRSSLRLTPALVALLLVTACPNLQYTACEVSCASLQEVAQLKATLPGPLTFSIGRNDPLGTHRTIECEASVARPPLLRNVIELQLLKRCV